MRESRNGLEEGHAAVELSELALGACLDKQSISWLSHGVLMTSFYHVGNRDGDMKKKRYGVKHKPISAYDEKFASDSLLRQEMPLRLQLCLYVGSALES